MRRIQIRPNRTLVLLFSLPTLQRMASVAQVRAFFECVQSQQEVGIILQLSAQVSRLLFPREAGRHTLTSLNYNQYRAVICAVARQLDLLVRSQATSEKVAYLKQFQTALIRAGTSQLFFEFVNQLLNDRCLLPQF